MSAGTFDMVTAEDAPLNVQLWPTRAPKYAPNYTLVAVAVAGDVVTWTYQNGTVRQFRKGEQVACQFVTAVAL